MREHKSAIIRFFISITVLFLIFLNLNKASIYGVESHLNEDSLYYTNPDYHVAKELFNKKIIMLGDYGHQSASPERRVIRTLDNWLNICKEKEKNYNLTLIIEYPPDWVNALNKYIRTGDLIPLLDKAINGISIQELEYYEMLRKFSRKIDSINNNINYKLSFKIAGFEQYTDSIYFNYLSKLPQRESELWFINTRDSMLAKNIIEYSNNNPDEQILVFYGLAHLQNGLLDKLEGSQVLQQNERTGYFLAHYLKQYFGESQVTTFGPNYCLLSELRYSTDGLHNIFKKKELEQERNEEIIFKPQELGHPIYWDTTFDYIINIIQLADLPIYTNNICSRYVFEKTVERINKIKNALPGYKATNNYRGYFRDLKFLTGQGFESDTDLNYWVSKNTYDGVDWLYNDKFSDTIKMMVSRIKDKRFINSTIRLYGLPYIPDSVNVTDDKWIQNELPKLLEQIKFTNSIGIYWIGYPDEKIKAKEYLIRFSGEDFAEPEKYLQWYRKKYFGYEY